MDISSTFARVVGSALAGSVGFFVGFYTGFFIVLSLWGLAADEISFVLATGTLGTIAAGGAIAFTVSASRRKAAFLTAVGLGLILVPMVLVLGVDAAGIAVVGLLLVVATSALVRTGTMDSIIH